MSVPKIRSVRLISATALFDGGGNGGKEPSAAVEVLLEDGGASVFAILSPQEPRRLLTAAGADFVFGTPVLFVDGIREAAVEEAAEAMAREMGGYWLRYYKSPGGPSRVFGGAGRETGAGGISAPGAAGREHDLSRGARPVSRPASEVRRGLAVAKVGLSDVDPPGRPDHACAVTQAVLRDGRRFSLLTATPSWFEAAFAGFGLRCYFGPQILFLHRLEARLAENAARALAAEGDRWLCLYDTPRTTLPRVLADFKSRHP